MRKERRFHACAARQNKVYVIGGADLHKSTSMEVWDGSRWDYFTIDSVRRNNLEILLQRDQLFVFGGTAGIYEDQLLTDSIWRIDNRNNFFEVTNEINKAGNNAVRFTVPFNFLTNCKGV